MKITKRVVPCLLGTIALTSCILFAINAYHANQSVSHVTAPEDPETTDAEELSSSAEKLSINFSERNMLYQPQDTADAAADSTQTGQTGANAAGSSSQPAKAEGQTKDNTSQNNGQALDHSTSQNGGQTEDNASQNGGQDNISQNSGQTGNNTSQSSGQDHISQNSGQTGNNTSQNGGQARDNLSQNGGQDNISQNGGQTGNNAAKTGKQSDSSTLQNSSQAEQKKDSDSSGNNKNNKKKKNKQKKDSSSQDQRNTFQTVSEDYFSDAVFIGDSRTVGLQQSGLLPDAAFYAKTGIGIGEILSKRIVNEGGYMISVKEALSRHSFGKVYIMIGINDMSMGDTEWYKEQYEEILAVVCQTQPDAIIYIQGNIPMSYNTQDLNGALNNQNLRLRDEAACALADSETIFYLDVNTLYADANGHLASMYTTDGLHIKPNYYPLWADYLMHRAIVR